MNNETNIPKDNLTKFNELIGSLSIINDSMKLFEKGKFYQILPISVQLRAILLDKRYKKSKNPLLFELSNIANNTDTHIWYSPKGEGPPSNPIISMDTTLPSLYKSFPSQKQISFKEWLEKDVLTVQINKEERNLSTSMVIKSYADKMGGAHYDDKVEDYFAFISSMSKQPLDALILSVADITKQIGVNICKKISSFDMQISIAINPKQKINNVGCIFLQELPNSPMKYGLLIDNLFKLYFILMNHEGELIRLVSKEEIDWNYPHIINITSQINYDLETEVILLVDGEENNKITYMNPLFVISDPIIYNGKFNSPEPGEFEPIEFGMSNFLAYSRVLQPLEKANNINWNIETIKNNEENCIVFNKDIFGTSEIGTKDMQFNKEVSKWSLSKVSKGIMPKSKTSK